MTDDSAGVGPVERGVGPLVEKLRGAASAGFDEWRVQDPEDGAYCMNYSWPDTLHPEREARAWLADYKARHPGGPHAHYVVACVRVVPMKDWLLAEAADALEHQQAEIADALHAMRAYARENPRHEYKGATQDPHGVHAWLARNERPNVRAKADAAGGRALSE
jgi:hypothetical protein